MADSGHFNVKVSIVDGIDHAVVAYPDGRLAAYLESLERLRDLAEVGAVTSIWPGHGPVLPDAISAYERALKLVPQYADAHYNLALAYERLQEPRRALRHWTRYIQLDPSGPWAAHAKTQAKRILGNERLVIVCRHGRTMRVR